MAMSFNENTDDNGEMHEINVTPFIDVMLVLLIILWWPHRWQRWM